ncbi:hypothetical protein NP493_460g04003 [Ridgeia piscesae]|uniref:Ribosome-recycling factor, mitochondrial n=1 Tax=Ridgeia piscesae TaxID=27915 RepID=A0AAD9KZ41_RIDPI|nr:hypothetical protein NP493_460g04003 [Ridgeia piscesae]
MKSEMDMALEHMKQAYFTQLTIRNTSGAFDNLAVETEDGKFPLLQLGQVLQKSPQLVVIKMASSPKRTVIVTPVSHCGIHTHVHTLQLLRKKIRQCVWSKVQQHSMPCLKSVITAWHFLGAISILAH